MPPINEDQVAVIDSIEKSLQEVRTSLRKMQSVFQTFKAAVNPESQHNQDVVWNDELAIHQPLWNAAKAEVVAKFGELP